MVTSAGLEPATSGLGIPRPILMSYEAAYDHLCRKSLLLVKSLKLNFICLQILPAVTVALQFFLKLGDLYDRYKQYCGGKTIFRRNRPHRISADPLEWEMAYNFILRLYLFMRVALSFKQAGDL